MTKATDQRGLWRSERVLEATVEIRCRRRSDVAWTTSEEVGRAPIEAQRGDPATLRRSVERSRLRSRLID